MFVLYVVIDKSDRVRLIESYANTDIGFKELFKNYGGICVESRILCRNCFQKLINLEKSVGSSTICVKKTPSCSCLSRGKRVASSRANEQRKRSNPAYQKGIASLLKLKVELIFYINY